MKTYKIIITAALTGALIAGSASCTDNFGELSKNPNASENALPHALLAPAVTSIVSSNMSRSRRINNELMQVTVLMGDVEGRIFRYDVRKSESDYLWNNWYVQLTNFKDMYRTAEELYAVEADKVYNTYMGISLICQSWVFSLLTDTYGDIPYFEACKGKEGEIMPAFDSQQSIYQDIFQQLEKANALLAEGANLPEDQSTSDPIFFGDAAKWRKFGNSLYLRLLLRISGKDDTAAIQIADILETNTSEYPVMESNDDSAMLLWTGVKPYTSPFYNMRDADWRLTKMAEFFLDNLNKWNDPRREAWATRINGIWEGMPSGYAVGEEVYAKSLPLLALKDDPRLGNMLNYAEVEFIRAEAAVKGYISSSAETHYLNGITAALLSWGYPVPAGYLDNPQLKWDESESFDDKMAKIHLQKYYALFYTDLQQWFENRRTGLPSLPKGEGLLNNKEMPSRLCYPVYLQTTNRENYFNAVAAQGPDNINTKVWWQRSTEVE